MKKEELIAKTLEQVKKMQREGVDANTIIEFQANTFRLIEEACKENKLN